MEACYSSADLLGPIRYEHSDQGSPLPDFSGHCGRFEQHREASHAALRLLLRFEQLSRFI